MSNDKSSIPDLSSIPSSMEDKQPEKATTSANVVNTAQIPTIASKTLNQDGSVSIVLIWPESATGSKDGNQQQNAYSVVAARQKIVIIPCPCGSYRVRGRWPGQQVFKTKDGKLIFKNSVSEVVIGSLPSVIGPTNNSKNNDAQKTVEGQSNAQRIGDNPLASRATDELKRKTSQDSGPGSKKMKAHQQNDDSAQDRVVEIAKKLLYLTAVQLSNHRETDLSGFLSKIDELLKKLEEEVTKAERITKYNVLMPKLAGFVSNLDGLLEIEDLIERLGHIVRVKIMIEAKKPNEVEELKKESEKLRRERDALGVQLETLSRESKRAEVTYQIDKNGLEGRVTELQSLLDSSNSKLANIETENQVMKKKLQAIFRINSGDIQGEN